MRLYELWLPVCSALKVLMGTMNGSVGFYNNYSAYENGFGDVPYDFWLGAFTNIDLQAALFTHVLH